MTPALATLIAVFIIVGIYSLVYLYIRLLEHRDNI